MSNRYVQLILLLMIAGVCVLSLLICIGPRCGDGDCNGDETFEACALDCPRPPPPVVAKKGPRCGDGDCNGSEDHKSCPEDCPAAKPTNPTTSKPKPGGTNKGSNKKTAKKKKPKPKQPRGRCRDPKFREIVRNVLSKCDRACTVDEDNPLIGLDKEEFEQLFAHPDDEGYASYIGVFGCNTYNPRTGDCRGYDSYYAEPDTCPTVSAGFKSGRPSSPASCRRYSSAIETEFKKFLLDNKEAKQFILLGSASRTGNVGRAGKRRMSPENIELARKRAQNVEILLERIREEEPFDGNTYTVILDNEAQRYDSPEFLQMVRNQIDKLGSRKRGFTPTGKLAVNRSVMVVAISCDL